MTLFSFLTIIISLSNNYSYGHPESHMWPRAMSLIPPNLSLLWLWPQRKRSGNWVFGRKVSGAHLTYIVIPWLTWCSLMLLSVCIFYLCSLTYLTEPLLNFSLPHTHLLYLPIAHLSHFSNANYLLLTLYTWQSYTLLLSAHLPYLAGPNTLSRRSHSSLPWHMFTSLALTTLHT